ncbi:MAG: outer membrane lipoprotein-sorting protein [Bdellovibrionales bacterium]|nr:outer membrane lipoprotein-sorting protein [Bdellovibrionales bacterium]
MKKYLSWIVKHRKSVIFGTFIVTLGLLAQLRSLHVIIDPDSALPQTHPYIATGRIIENVFGNKFTVIVGVSPKEGTVYQPSVLNKVSRITDRILKDPASIKSNVMSLSARKAKDITGNDDGMTVRPMMEKVPTTPEDLLRLQQAVEKNPAYTNLLVSKDLKTTQIVAEFKKIDGGFQAIAAIVKEAVKPELDASVDIQVSGLPIFLGLLEKYSQRMGFLFPIALLIIGLIHYEAFRTLQALILPLVTALLAVAWSMGILGLLKEPFDVFNSSTPILILAIAAGHAVQILKRYYEEYGILFRASPNGDKGEMSRLAVLKSLEKVGPVMVVACTVASLGFFSLMIFEIKSIRTFGIFTGAGVLSALVLELTFIPALRAMLRPPNEKEVHREQSRSIWDRITEGFYRLASQRQKQVYIFTGLLILVLSLGGFFLKVENSQKGYFYGKIAERLDDDAMNSKMAGTNPFYVLIDGKTEDALKRPDVLRAMEGLQLELEKSPWVGKTISLVDFLKKMNQSLNSDRKEFFKLPTDQNLVAQYLLLYSNSGEPGDFDSYVDYTYQRGVVTAFLKTDSSTVLTTLANQVKEYTKDHFPADVDVKAGGGSLGGVALNEIMIREKVLNILQILGAVFVVTSLVFRSLTAGMLILVPLLAAVAVNFGVMGLFGIPLQIATALVSAMAVGIGADYGIYMSYRMREELRTHSDEKEALARAFGSAGKATLFVSTAVAGGFGVLMLSWGFMIHLWMGFLIAVAMLVSSVTTLTLFPALIFSLRPKFIFEERKTQTMKNLKSVPALLILVFLAGSAQAGAPLTAVEIAKKSFSASKVADSKSDSTFRLINASGQERVRKTTGSTKLIPGTTDNQRLVIFESPADVKGTKTLLIEHSKGDDDIWIYLPAMKKVRRLVSSNKKDSFVGTDFSYGDVIGHRVEDWNHKLLKEEKVDGRDCYVTESTPARPEVGENSGYSKRTGCIDKESFIALRGEAFDLNGALLKKFAARKIQKVDDKNQKWQPMEIESENVQTGHRTVIEFQNYKANTGVSSDLFTARTLEKQ